MKENLGLERESVLVVLGLIIIVLVSNLSLFKRIDKLESKLEGQIEQIDITTDCPHSSTDTIKVIYIQSNTDAEENQEIDENVDENINEETDEEVDTNVVTDTNVTVTTSPVIEQVNETEQVTSTGNYSEAEINTICGVVEAETHGADTESKIHIVHVILNRVNSPRFPSSVIEVCNQPNQFASRSDIEQSTIDAVYAGLATSDTTQGALFFHSGSLTSTFNGASYLFTDNVGHHFYR